ncbi:MAG: mevalonate kinase [Candidatus Nezhaarchaeota archaeon]|nr:mevalonate kinase [Candidatus Nezhaarchaeota archaeon]
MAKRVVASAPGKVILTGEHFVVHGEPCLAMAIDLRAFVEARLIEEGGCIIEAPDLGIYWREGGPLPKPLAPVKLILDKFRRSSAPPEQGVQVRIYSNLPASAGLGSSAAVAAAAAKSIGMALGEELSDEEVFQLALEAEKLVHVNPSGVDPLVSTVGGVIAYRRGEGYVDIDPPVRPTIVIGLTKPRGTTGAMVRKVERLRRGFPEVLAPLFHAGGHLTIEAANALKLGDLERLGRLLDINHGLLCAIGVSTRKIDKLVYLARRAGALGAKLTGAGGGGCMIALCYDDVASKVAWAIERGGGVAMKVRMESEGVRVEEIGS